VDDAVKWTRLYKGGRFRWIAEHDGALFVRSDGSIDAKIERVESDLASYSKKLRRAGWEDYDVVERPLPLPPPSAEVKARVKLARANAFGGLRNAYRMALDVAGFRFAASFVAQTRADQDANALAEKCLSIAESAFHVEFARACFDDVEHGTGGWPLPAHEFARFYVSPARVQQLAERRATGKLREDDGRFPKR
jgi:hypothetical protein